MSVIAGSLGRARLLIKRVDALKSDHAAAWYSFLSQAWASLSGFVLVLVAASKLTAVEQGYFFTFFSLLQTQVFFELGFGVVLTQYVSHEWAHLEVKKGVVSGDEQAAARLGSLIRMGLRWYRIAGIAFVILVGIAGHLFFLFTGNAHDSVRWLEPWWFLVVAHAGAMMYSPLSAVLEGAGRVDVNQKALLVANVMASSIAWGALFMGTGLFALPLLVAVRAALAPALLLPAARPILQLRRLRGAEVSWSHEFWPQQWRIAASWCAGLVMFQSFTPIAFAVRGAAVSGEVGVSVQMFHAVNRLGSAWVTAAQPYMGRLGAWGRFDDLRSLVRVTLWRSLATASVVAVAGIGFVAALQAVLPEYGSRFGDLPVMAVFVGVAVALQGPNVVTAAVRFQKREPFVATMWAFAIAVVASNMAVGRTAGAMGMALGFAMIVVAAILPSVIVIYRRTLSRLSASRLEGGAALG